MKKYITEFIGTFFLTMTVGMVVLGGKGDFAPLAIGSVFDGHDFCGGTYFRCALQSGSYAGCIDSRQNITW